METYWWNPAVTRKSLPSGGLQSQRCVCMCFIHTLSHLCLEALLAWLWIHSHYLDLQSQLHSWIPNRNLFWFFHCSPLWVEQKTKSRTQMNAVGLCSGHCGGTSPEPSPQFPTPRFIITRGVRLFDRNWFWPDLQDLGKHTFLGGVHSLSLWFNLPEKKFKGLQLN